MMYRCKICSEHYLSTESLQDHQFASHTEEALEAFGITKVSINETKVLDWQHRSNENKHDILQKMGYPPHDIQTLMSLEFYQFGSNIQKEIGEALNKSTPIKQRAHAVETDENKTYQNMYDSYLQTRSAQIKRPFQDGVTEAKATEYTMEDLERVGVEWDNSSVAEKKEIIIDTHNGYTEGHDDNIVKNWNELSDHTRTVITQGKSNESLNTVCPECGSKNTSRQQTKFGGGQAPERFDCKKCGNVFKPKSNESKASEADKTYTCDKCGKVGDSFSGMAQEECPNNDRGGHQIPIFGDQLKSTRPTRADVEGNEKEELLSDIIAKINKKYGGGDQWEKEQEEKGESMDDDDREGRMQWMTGVDDEPITDKEAELLLYGTTDGSKGGTWTGNVSRPRGEAKSSEVDENEKDEIFEYLFELQDSGETNMMGASPYVKREFPHLDEKEISNIVVEWMSNWDEIARRMGIESRVSEGFDQGGIIGYVDAKCKTCGVEFNSPQMMDAHYRDNRDHESNLGDLHDESDISMWTESLVGEALKSHTDYHKLVNSTLSGDHSITCSKCTKKFKGQESLNIHYNDKHADNELKSLVVELNSGEGHWVNSNPFDLTSDAEYVEDEDYEVTPAPKPEPEQKEEGEAMVEDIVHKTESGVDITHPQDEWCKLCDEPTTSFEADDMSDDDYDEKVEDLMKDEGVDEITDFDEEEKKDFFKDVDDIKITDEEQKEDGEAVGLSNNWDDDEKRMDGGDVPQVEEDPYKDHYTGDARKQMQNDIKDLSNPYDLTTDIKGKPWQERGESLTEEQELQQARESLAPLNKLDDEKSNVTKAFESGASAEDIYSKVGDTTQDRGSEDDLTDIYNKVGVKLNLEKV